MDADTAPVVQQAIIAACKGQSYVDETFEDGTGEHGFYTASRILFDSDSSTWRVLLKAAQVGGVQTLGPHQLRRLRSKLRKILDEIDPEL